jgi:hypothetical protein
MRKILFVIVFIFLHHFSLNAKEFSVASYNVENLFDLKYDGSEYKEYIPNSKYWNQQALKNKLQNLSKTINDLDANIIALQEIESQDALDSLLKRVTKYKYHKFLKNNSSSVGVAILSTYPIIKSQRVVVNKRDKYSRDILKATVKIEDKPLVIYVNHWRSKKASESQRIIYASALKKDIDKLSNDIDYIILGDLNSNYNEYQTFKYDKKLNDTFGITGINQILNTTIDENFITKKNIQRYKKIVHYNLWLELKNEDRFSTKFKNYNNTPDNIIVSKSLFDNKNISYIHNSFKVFKTNYLYKKNKIIRWNKYKSIGHSDHLPIYAKFTTNSNKTNIDSNPNKLLETTNNTIEFLYEVEQVKDFKLNNIVVIYKRKNIAIIKHSNKNNSRAILIYKPNKSLKLGYSYNIVVEKIEKYNGLKEIKNISYIKQLKYLDNYKQRYIDANTIDLFNQRYQNEIITNLSGIYKKGKLYFNLNNKTKKIKLYFKKGIKKPEDGKSITITSGHLSIYKSKIQIVLYSTNDFI